MKKKLIINDQEVEVDILSKKDGKISFVLNDKEYTYRLTEMVEPQLTLKTDPHNFNIPFAKNRDGKIFASVNGKDVFLELPQKGRATKKGDDAGHMVSPMPGKIFKLIANEGDSVKKGDPILIMEAMKMEHTIRANIDGLVEKIFYKEGEQIDGGVELVSIKAAEK